MICIAVFKWKEGVRYVREHIQIFWSSAWNFELQSFFVLVFSLYLKLKLTDSYMQLTYLKPEVRFSSVILNFNKGALRG